MLIQYYCQGTTLGFVIHYSNGTSLLYVLGVNATSIPTPLPLGAYAPLAQLLTALALLALLIALGGSRTWRVVAMLGGVLTLAWSLATPLYVTATINCGSSQAVTFQNPLFIYGLAAVGVSIAVVSIAVIAELIVVLRGGWA